MKANSPKHESKPGFVKLMRSPETHELLLNDPLSFALLANIALRARWRTKFDMRGLKFGEALMGDFGEIGFTRQQYRTRLKRLRECGLVTTRPTPRGTIVRLHSTAVFDLGLCPNDCLTSQQKARIQPPTLRGKPAFSQPTVNQPTTNSQPLTNNDRRKERKNDELVTLGNSTAATPNHAEVGKSGFVCKGHQIRISPFRTM